MKIILSIVLVLLIEAHCSPVSAETTLEFSMVVGGKRSDGPSVCTTDGEGNCYIIGETNSPDFPFTIDDPDLHIDRTGKNFIMKLSPSGKIISITSPFYVRRILDCVFDIKSNTLVLLYVTFESEFVLSRLDHDGKEILSSNVIPCADTLYGAMAMDKSGRIYVAGSVESGDFPTTPNAWQTSFAGGSTDAFIWVFSPDLETCEYATFFGGTENEHIDDIAIDSNGYVHVVGYTTSDDFPLTDNAIDNKLAHGGYPSGGFYAVFSHAFNELIYSTFLFNTSDIKMVVDSKGSAIIAGSPSDYRMAASEHSYDSGVQYYNQILVFSIDPFTPTINYAAYIAGDQSLTSYPRSWSYSILVDSDDHPIAVGTTNTENYPVTVDAFQKEYNGVAGDTVVSELDETGSSLLYSTYLGGSGEEIPRCATLDKDGNLWIAGQTESRDFPADLKIQYDGYDVWNEGDVFVCKFARNSQPTAVTEAPAGFHVNAPYPNPFNAMTTISFTLPKQCHASLTVYNLAGQMVRSLVEGQYSAGTHRIVWDGLDEDRNAVAAGVYVTRLTAGGTVATGKMVLVK